MACAQCHEQKPAICAVCTSAARDWEFSWLARNLAPVRNQKIHWISEPGSATMGLNVNNRGQIRWDQPSTPIPPGVGVVVVVVVARAYGVGVRAHECVCVGGGMGSALKGEGKSTWAGPGVGGSTRAGR
jgi:uncharacterized membrane protein